MRARFVAVLAVVLAAGQALALTPNDVTQTAPGVRPALEEICSKTQAQAGDVAFLRRMYSRGFEPDGEQFRYMGDDGELIVSDIGEGCTLRIDGDAAMIAEADRQLQAFAVRAGLTAQVTDQNVSADGVRRTERVRAKPDGASLSWTMSDSRIEGVYSRHGR